ncbi:MAG: hypothetical protein HRF47_13720 [Chloroflexota bacterium]|jgi:hypothetical protein
MASKYFKTVAFLLLKLFDIQQQEWSQWKEKERNENEMEQSPALQSHRVISGWYWQIVNENKITKIFSSETEVLFSSERLVLFLPPFPSQQREFVPVMTLSYKPSDEPSNECIKIRVGMYRLENGEPCGFAFRLESPTSICKEENRERNGIGIHDFYHVQFMKNFENYAPVLHSPDWLPEYQPAICVRANNPVEAILGLVLSLYGLDYFKQFLKQVKSNVRDSDIPLLRDFA